MSNKKSNYFDDFISSQKTLYYPPGKHPIMKWNGSKGTMRMAVVIFMVFAVFFILLFCLLSIL